MLRDFFLRVGLRGFFRNRYPHRLHGFRMQMHVGIQASIDQRDMGRLRGFADRHQETFVARARLLGVVVDLRQRLRVEVAVLEGRDELRLRQRADLHRRLDLGVV
ncbi:hypothetical protein D3C76_1623300 [compost metagenome]